MIKMKVYTRGVEVLVAACDADILGKVLRQGELRLHVSSFYDGERVSEEEFLKQLGGATIGNLVGKVTVDAAKRAGYISDEGILWIDGVPHAQLFVMKEPVES